MTSVLSMSLAWLLSVMLTVAAVTKLRDPEPAADFIRALGYRLDGAIHVRVLAIVEATLAVMLITMPSSQMAPLAVAVLMAFFMVVLAKARRINLAESCGCFGGSGGHVGIQHLLRNGMLCAAAVASALLPSATDYSASMLMMVGVGVVTLFIASRLILLTVALFVG